MIYAVAPRECGEELYEKLVDHYRDDPNVTVIVDRRERDRRGRRSAAAGEEEPDVQRRRVRDRRRRRVVGELSSVRTADG
jgi:hypothetical protein